MVVHYFRRETYSRRVLLAHRHVAHSGRVTGPAVLMWGTNTGVYASTSLLQYWYSATSALFVHTLCTVVSTVVCGPQHVVAV
jgi:hypothetical protein